MRNREQAEDVLIAGFMAIFEKISTFRDEGSFEGWMKKVMMHTAISTIRADEMRYCLESDERILNDAGIASSQNVTYSAINVRDIMRQVQLLPDGCRTVFNLHEIEGYSYEEITDILNISRGTVASQLARAKKILKEKLKGYR
jgi:RNA polymerase sigma-70 factor (ECF subfamily)